MRSLHCIWWENKRYSYNIKSNYKFIVRNKHKSFHHAIIHNLPSVGKKPLFIALVLKEYTVKYLCCCVAVAEKEAHRERYCGHPIPRGKHSLCTRHDCLQLPSCLRRGPSGQPLHWQSSLQGDLFLLFLSFTLPPVINDGSASSCSLFSGVSDSSGWRTFLWPGPPKPCCL